MTANNPNSSRSIDPYNRLKCTFSYTTGLPTPCQGKPQAHHPIMDTITPKDHGEPDGSQRRLQAPDRWFLWPPVAVVAGAFGLALLSGWPGTVSFFLIPLMALSWPIAVVALAMAAGLLFVRGRPRKTACLLAAALLAIVLWKPICWTADCVHAALTTQFGLGQLGSPSAPEDNSFAAYDWSVGLAGGSNTFLLRDPTDEIALPLAKHKHPVASENGFGEQCAGRVSHLFGHYYRCTF